MKKMVCLAGILLFSLLGLSLDQSLAAKGSAFALEHDQLRLEIEREPFQIRITDRAGAVLLQTSGPLRFTTVHDQRDPYAKGKAEPWIEVGEVAASRQAADRIEVELAARPGEKPLVKLAAFFLNERTLKVEAEVLDRPEVNRLSFRFQSAPDDRYYGLGERFESAEHHGQRLLVWTEEQHVGLGKLADKFADKPYNPWPHGPTTYFPVPFFLNPAGYGFLLDDTHPSEFDFGQTSPEVLEITNWNSRFDFLVFYGPKPLQVLEAYTAFTGRVKISPAWVFGVWNAAADKEARLKVVAQTTRRERIPTSAIWSEDWAWPGASFLSGLLQEKWDWDLNRERYPDYEQMARQLHQDGFRFLGYFMPYIGAKSEAFKLGADQGYLAQNPAGQAYAFRWIVPKVGEPDLTNPAACAWWQESFFQKAADSGVDGWMHDFSEYTPADAGFADGRDGLAVHNDYPRLWAELGREFWEKARPDGDWVFFMRAGYTGSWRSAPVMWTGDQNMDWERFDGIPSVIPAVNSVGISGSPITATDIAGYHCFPILDKPTDKELFFRWTELGALLPVMRIHESSGCANNWLFDSDQETLRHWKEYAKLHVALFPYFYTLVYEAAARGWPVVRHLVLHYPDDPGSQSEESEFLVGDRVLAAPVIVEGAREREVYFPPGAWVDFWDGTRYQGPGKAAVAAPLEKVPLFVKAGTLLPLFDAPIDTLVQEDRDDLNGWDDANRSIQVLFFGEGEDDLTIWDGTRFHCRRAPGEPGGCQVMASPVTRTYSFEFR